MMRAEKKQLLRKVLLKSMGYIIAPLTFALIIAGISLLAVNAVVGDVVGYASLMLLDLPEKNNSVSNFELAEDIPPDNSQGTPVETVPYVDIKDVTFPSYEQVYGELSIPSVGILCPLVYGDSKYALTLGAGQYIGSRIIGYPGTTFVCAHVNRQFKTLNQVQVGDEVRVRTLYGVYTYRISYVGVHEASDDSVYDLASPDENLVLYTCYYDYSGIGSVKKRFFACADYVSGPLIRDGGGQE